MNCPVCGAQNLPNSAFCSQCATSLLVPPHLAGPAPHMMPRTSGMAIAGFVLSFFCGMLGLIFSCIGYSESRKSNGMVQGEGLAMAGIVISIVQLVGFFAIYGSGRHH